MLLYIWGKDFVGPAGSTTSPHTHTMQVFLQFMGATDLLKCKKLQIKLVISTVMFRGHILQLGI